MAQFGRPRRATVFQLAVDLFGLYRYRSETAAASAGSRARQYNDCGSDIRHANFASDRREYKIRTILRFHRRGILSSVERRFDGDQAYWTTRRWVLARVRSVDIQGRRWIIET